MLHAKLIADSLNETFKKQELNIDQKKKIRRSLTESKYSKLGYNSIEFLDKNQRKSNTNTSFNEIRSQDHDSSKENDEIENGTVNTPTRTNKHPIFEKSLTEQHENEIEIEKIIESPKDSHLSPSNFYLNLQQLSIKDEKYLETHDKYLTRKFEEATRAKIAPPQKKPNDFFNRIQKFKQEQDDLKKELQSSTPKIQKSLPKILDEPTLTQPVPKPLNIKDDKTLVNQEERDRQARIISMIDKCKNLAEKFESSNVKDLLQTNFQDSIDIILNQVNNLENSETKLVNECDEIVNKLKTYSQEIKNVKEKISKEKQEEIKKQQELKDRRDKFTEELKVHEKNIKIVQSSIKNLVENFKSKNQTVLSINNQELCDQVSLNLKICQQVYTELDTILEKYLKESLNSVDKFETEDMNSRNLKLKDVHLKFEVFKNEFEIKLKQIDERIEKAKREKEEQDTKMRLKQAEEEIEKMKKQAQEEAERIKKEAQLEAERIRKSAEEESARKAQEALKLKQEKAESGRKKAEMVNLNDKNGINSVTIKRYEDLRQKLDNLRVDTENSLSDPSFKLYKFDLQKAINFPLNTLLEDKTSDENRRNFNEKIKTLIRLLSGQTCAITSTLTVNPTKHPKAIDFCLVFLAKKLVEKGEETVGSRPETSFQYVQLANDVIKQIPSFEEILIAQMQEKCPYTVPFYKNRKPGQSNEEFFESLGYKIISGKIEEEVHYFKRMSGVLHLYFTMLIYPVTSTGASCRPSNEGLKMAWNWLTDTLNMTPRPNITAEMLSIFFKCCGYQLQMNYRKQFLKLVKICFDDFLQLIKEIPEDMQSGASVGRLTAVYEQFKNENYRFTEWRKL